MPSFDLLKTKDWSGLVRPLPKNRVRVKVNTSAVGENLTDFPLYLPFSPGDNSSAILAHFSAAAGTYSFTGTDGSPPDLAYWYPGLSVNNSVYIKSNLLHFAALANQPNVFFRYMFEGDFDLEVGFQGYTEVHNWNATVVLQEEAMTTGQWGFGAYIGMMYYSGVKYWTHDYTVDGWSTGAGYVSAARTNTYGRFRLARSGSTITFQYKDGAGAFTTIATRTFAGRLRLYINPNDISASAASWDITDFKINSVAYSRPFTGVIRDGFASHIVVADGKDNVLPCHILPWFATQGGLLVKVPTLYSAVPSELRIYYDKTQPQDLVNGAKWTGFANQSVNVCDDNVIGAYYFADIGNVTGDSSPYAMNSGGQVVSAKNLNCSLFSSFGASYLTATKYTAFFSNYMLNSLRSFTMEVIYTPTVDPTLGWPKIFSRCTVTEADPCDIMSILLNFADTYPRRFRGSISNGAAGSSVVLDSTTRLSLNTPYYLVLSYDYASTTMKIYVNGVREGINAAVASVLPQLTTPLCIGNSLTNLADGVACGTVNFARISNVARSDAWVSAAYRAFAGSLFTYYAAEAF